MFTKLLLLFTVIPAFEIYLLFKVGNIFGALNTFLLVIVTGIVGASFARSQGFETLVKIQDQINRGGLPGNEIIHGLMIFAGGILLVTPGILTDVVGLSLVAPGTRHLLFHFFKSMIMNGLKNGNIKFSSFGGQAGGGFSYSQHSSYEREEFQGARSTTQQTVDSDVFEAEYVEKK